MSSLLFFPLAVTPPSRLAILLDTPPVSPTDHKSSWSPTHHSPNFSLSQCGTVAQRAPAEQSTDGVRGAEGQQGGLHVWEVNWDPAERGSHAVLGVSTQHCSLQASGYTVLVGGDAESWGWELGSNQLWHGGIPCGQYPRRGTEQGEEFLEQQRPLAVPSRVLMVLDGDAGTLGFVVDGCFLGVAMQNLPLGVHLFPAVSSVWGGCRITLRYLNGGPSMSSMQKGELRDMISCIMMAKLYTSPWVPQELRGCPQQVWVGEGGGKMEKTYTTVLN
ncbi:hypothetical protein JZ751_006703 [Albula glossodonta]|uniref:B30.2/SPRY domain-containing protein n=1 Tax=Albula glossodonta TaxID=121402 RepID=A0A8T2P9T8_9TELE|nr:hypothetical protein JZ751_006703 [Albula glossodonta]